MVNRFLVYCFDGVRANGVVMIFGTEVVCFSVQVIHALMIQIRDFSIIHNTILIHMTNIHTIQIRRNNQTVVSIVEVRTLAPIVRLMTIIIMTNLHNTK